MHLQSLKLLRQKVQEEKYLQKKKIFDLDFGVKVTRNFAQYPLKLLRLTVKEEIHLQENTLFDL